MSGSRLSVIFWVAGLALALAIPGSALAAEDKDPAGEKPKAPEVKPEQVSGGLEISMVMKERTIPAFGNNAERKVKAPTLRLKNVGDKPLVLGFQLAGGGPGGRGGAGGGGEPGPVKFFAKDAAGKEVPRPEQPAPAGQDQPKPEDRPATLTVLKPGQVLEQSGLGGLRLPADGKYTIWAEIDVPAKDEVLPGVKPWSGKLKSNELEYDYQGGGRGGGRGNRGGNQPPAAAPAAPPAVDKEIF